MRRQADVIPVFVNRMLPVRHLAADALEYCLSSSEKHECADGDGGRLSSMLPPLTTGAAESGISHATINAGDKLLFDLTASTSLTSA